MPLKYIQKSQLILNNSHARSYDNDNECNKLFRNNPFCPLEVFFMLVTDENDICLSNA